MLPYWRTPKEDEVDTLIPNTVKELWISHRLDDFLLALIRTKEEDRPIIIDEDTLIDKGKLISFLDSLPSSVHTITIHGENEDIRIALPETSRLRDLATFPTVAFIGWLPKYVLLVVGLSPSDVDPTRRVSSYGDITPCPTFT
ncbi:hypothetical protein CPB86DRAFT_328770 [Serendipita vermifera]|nr:hypothetical protein CPB86DRAFT_328770 [Serendipita vermifera]